MKSSSRDQASVELTGEEENRCPQQEATTAGGGEGEEEEHKEKSSSVSRDLEGDRDGTRYHASVESRAKGEEVWD